MATLKQLLKRFEKSKNQLVGIYEDSNSPIQLDYADEILETHGNKKVLGYAVTHMLDDIIVVELEEK